VIDAGDRLRGVGFDGELVSEGFEFVNEPAFAGVGTVDAAGEVVRAEVAVGGGLGEHMSNDHDQGVGGGGSGLLATLFAEPAVEAAELGTDIGAGAPGGSGALGEDLAEFLVALAGLAGSVPSGGFVVARA
jgi:hypothetical protein